METPGLKTVWLDKPTIAEQRPRARISANDAPVRVTRGTRLSLDRDWVYNYPTSVSVQLRAVDGGTRPAVPVVMTKRSGMSLTPTQRVVLRDAKAGHVYRSERGHDLYACYDRAQGDKKVTAIVERLSALGLLSIGDQALMQRPWHVTEQGDEVLCAVDASERTGR